MYPHTRFPVYLHFTKTFLRFGCAKPFFIVTSWLEKSGKEVSDMINTKLMDTDVDEMIFDMNDYYISEK